MWNLVIVVALAKDLPKEQVSIKTRRDQTFTIGCKFSAVDFTIMTLFWLESRLFYKTTFKQHDRSQQIRSSLNALLNKSSIDWPRILQHVSRSSNLLLLRSDSDLISELIFQLFHGHQTQLIMRPLVARIGRGAFFRHSTKEKTSIIRIFHNELSLIQASL